MTEKRRIDAIDALRGLAVILMVIHHALYDAFALLGAPFWLYWNPVFAVLHYIFAGVFVALAGVSSRFSRSNLRRGLACALAAVIVSIVSYFAGDPIYFGVLHLLAVCMLLSSILVKYAERIQKPLAPLIVCALLTAASAVAMTVLNPVSVSWLFPVGLYTQEFVTGDYFPLFPWIFLFAAGVLSGGYIRDGKLPRGFYNFTTPILPKIGRRALWIYLAHQPVLYGIMLLISRFVAR
ncbi:MAG: DUF1624 domain-containing protein [Oscillospiraceae bacterium]|jgi:uncharacterized membrane protein|nr:DUF1624 domain-containing protein [Oscillospiraceae bacterium]